ncbi:MULTISPECIES: DUF3800 domain-containing protein [Bacillus]|uniref:DUF3800 domain-containing protein n=1 Tax=Bacillus TaxID=1386 RepID=UPI0013787E8E|nr:MULTISPECIES: DUF3800 domain-containing protein [Bacillus]MDY7903526.1 DUF3800 domain-containing protein [Bacillus sp. AG1]NCT27077.1 DUF3800 domain-containing protein [Bacillus velezensis]
MTNLRNQPCSCGSGVKFKKCCMEHLNKYTVFCDESGNSGGNYLDLNQPFFVIAGWIVPNTILKNTAFLDECASSLGVPGELKSNKLLNRKKARQEFINLFERLGESGCVPVFVFAEKKYCIAAKVIETLLDPAYNDKVDTQFTYDNLKKKVLAEKVYLFPDEQLADFINSYKDNNVEKMTQCIIRLSEYALSEGLDELSTWFKGALSTIESNMASERAAHRSLPKKSMEAINVPVFISLIQMIEELGRKTQNTFSLIHDETQQFEDSYIELYRRFATAPPFEANLTDGNSILMGYKHLKEFSIGGSTRSRWIQAADILAGVIGRLLEEIHGDNLQNEELLELARTLIPSFVSQEIKLSDSVCSNKTREKIFNVILPS